MEFLLAWAIPMLDSKLASDGVQNFIWHKIEFKDCKKKI